MDRYKIISTCGITGNSINNKDRMKKMLISEIFYDLYKINNSVEEASKRIFDLIPYSQVNALEDLFKKLITDIYNQISNDSSIDKIKIQQAIEEKIEMIEDEKKKEVLGFCQSYITNCILKLQNKDCNIDSYVVLDMKKFLRAISAECNALAFYIDEYILDGGDIEDLAGLYFLSSDNDIGYNAAKNTSELAKIMLTNIYGSKNNSTSFEVYRVKGFDIKNKEDFVKIGINDLLMKLFDIRYEDKNDICALNITGGYKNAIPYLVYFASGFDLELFYIYDGSEYGIILPRIPLAAEFDDKYLEKLESVKSCFENGKSRLAIDKAYQCGIQSLINKKDKTFSEFGDILIKLIKEKMNREVKFEEKEKKKKTNIFGKFKRK